MMQQTNKKIIFLLAMLSCTYNIPTQHITRYPVNCSLKPYNVTVLLVTDNDDDATNPATLRGALAIAQPGETINFALQNGNEEILLNEENGPLRITVPLIIDGSNTAGSQEQVTINGQSEINIGFIVESTAPSTTIQNITIKNFSGNSTDPGTGTAPQELFACGILIETNALNCFISHCTIDNILSGVNTEAAGIYSNASTCPIVHNTITNISSASSTGSEIANGSASGSVFGIFVDGDIQGQCSNNIISFLTSGNVIDNSGDIWGIFTSGSIQNNCTHNTFSNFGSGSALQSGHVLGVQSNLIEGDFSCNTMTLFETAGGLDTTESGNIQGAAINENILGSFSYNTFDSFTTGDATISSGYIKGLLALQIGGTVSYNALTLFVTGHSNGTSGEIRGLEVVIFESDIIHNMLTQFTSGSGALSGFIEGISTPKHPSEIGGTLAYNTLSQFATGMSTQDGGSSGHIKGIEVDIIGGRVHDNMLEIFTTGETTIGTAESTSGSISGIKIASYLRGDIINNTLQQMIVSDVANAIGFVQGIFIQTINTDRLVACNTIDTLQGNSPNGSETSNSSLGLAIQKGNNITICHNTITNLTGLADSPIYGLLLGNDPSDQSVTSSTIGDNVISNIIGGNQNGFGIVIVDEDSLGNKLFNNLIFDINGKAIVILDPLADTTNKTVTLNSIQCTSSGKLIINGTFNPDPSFDNDPFLLQFFASNNNTPPEAMILIGEQTVTANGTPTFFVVELKPCPPTEYGQFLTATATALVDPNNNTTELSNAIEACASINPLCSVMMNSCMPPKPPEVCPISLTGAPPVPCPCPSVIVPPCPEN